jgi:hypothetical protein
MKIIKPEEAPINPTARQAHGTWKPVFEALEAGNAVELVNGEDFVDESRTRNSVSLSMKRWGIIVTIRKDTATGNLYVFRKDAES